MLAASILTVSAGTASAGTAKCLTLANGRLCSHVNGGSFNNVVVGYTKNAGATITAYFGYQYPGGPAPAETSQNYTFPANSGLAHPFDGHTAGRCVNSFMHVHGQGTFWINNVCP